MLAGQNFEQHIDEVLSVEGDKVTTRTLMDMDDTRALGVQVVSTQVYVVQDGKIKSVRCDWSDETLAALAAAAKALPETGMPVGNVVLFPSQALLLLLGGLILLGSLGLVLRSRHS